VPPARTLTLSELAQQLGVTTRAVERYVKDGLPCTKGGPGRPTRFNLEESQRWMQRSGRTGQRGRPTAARRAAARERAEDAQDAPAAPPRPPAATQEQPEDAGGEPADAEPPPDVLDVLPQDLEKLSAQEIDRRTAIAQLRKIHWQARQARALALETEGRLVDRDEIARQRVERIQAVRARHEVVPSRLGWKLVGKTKPEIEELLAAEMAAIGEEFAKEPSA
jgi:hypothetical protein